MKLLTKRIRSKLPETYSTQYGKDPKVFCKFFLPMTRWTWYATEFDGEDLFFGYVVGDYPELGYFRLSELISIEGPYGLTVERDLYFNPQPLSEIKKLHE
ncbi:DUF2958 domain-containing protein [Patescibacteria group bacterium]|nr:DUF2958 domain-containing protein [Patescibacteria group bacterium]